MKMPPVDKDALKNRPALVRQLRAILPEASVIVDEASLRAYETDALTFPAYLISRMAARPGAAP